MERLPYKKLYDNIACEVGAEVAVVAGNPDIGEQKKGDLAQLRGYKFRISG